MTNRTPSGTRANNRPMSVERSVLRGLRMGRSHVLSDRPYRSGTCGGLTGAAARGGGEANVRSHPQFGTAPRGALDRVANELSGPAFFQVRDGRLRGAA